MKYAIIIGLGVSICAASLQAAPAKLQSVYGKVFDAPGCKVEKFNMRDEAEPEGEAHNCPGPVSGVRTEYSFGGDWNPLTLIIDQKNYSLWEPMVEVGGFSGVGNRQGTIEWLFAPGKPRNRARLKALIVRFEGSVMGEDGNISGGRSQLSVIDLTPGKLCWRGNFNDNVSARKAAESGECKKPLEVETPIPVGQ
jgi:hypothetical protein